MYLNFNDADTLAAVWSESKLSSSSDTQYCTNQLHKPCALVYAFSDHDAMIEFEDFFRVLAARKCPWLLSSSYHYQP